MAVVYGLLVNIVLNSVDFISELEFGVNILGNKKRFLFFCKS